MKPFRQGLNDRHLGFTLIELLVTIAVAAVLMMVAAPSVVIKNVKPVPADA